MRVDGRAAWRFAGFVAEPPASGSPPSVVAVQPPGCRRDAARPPGSVSSRFGAWSGSTGLDARCLTPPGRHSPCSPSEAALDAARPPGSVSSRSVRGRDPQGWMRGACPPGRHSPCSPSKAALDAARPPQSLSSGAVPAGVSLAWSPGGPPPGRHSPWSPPKRPWMPPARRSHSAPVRCLREFAGLGAKYLAPRVANVGAHRPQQRAGAHAGMVSPLRPLLVRSAPLGVNGPLLSTPTRPVLRKPILLQANS